MGGGFRKINIFWGMKILWIFFGSSQNWTKSFSNIFGVLEILDSFLG